MPQLVTLGETMVVFDPLSTGPLRYTDQFKKRIGGAESNVALGVARLGHQVGWVSKVGNDPLGEYMVSTIRGEGVDTSKVAYDEDAPTGLYIKEKIREGTNQVYYYRHGSAASQLRVEDIDWDYLREAEIIHLTGITPFISDRCLEVAQAVASFANQHGIFLSFDPNLRMKLLKKKADHKKILLELASKANLVMPGLDEAKYLLDTDDSDQIIDYFFQHNVEHVIIKNGEVGTTFASRQGDKGFVPSFPVARVVDPIGAGDGFAAGVLSSLLEHRPLQEAVEQGALIGAIMVSTPGDIEGLPSRQEIELYKNTQGDVVR
ncbi:sugar kinase [Caldalkalibacillus salinus]|uniref:sugar kinase n=1 Tax=Caldalkalibacillus salinus TaxID=2803787 RepID=UPI001922FF24|nr:sugar kinase [Caldalkalibacillus salinus]